MPLKGHLFHGGVDSFLIDEEHRQLLRVDLPLFDQGIHHMTQAQAVFPGRECQVDLDALLEGVQDPDYSGVHNGHGALHSLDRHGHHLTGM